MLPVGYEHFNRFYYFTDGFSVIISSIRSPRIFYEFYSQILAGALGNILSIFYL